MKIKLNLLDDNKFEFVLFSGDYKIKGDSLLFCQNIKTESPFNLEFVKDKNAKKIKIKFSEPHYIPFYIGTQNDSEPVLYQEVAEMKQNIDTNLVDGYIEFEIDRANYLYLVYERPGHESKISKFVLPKDISEVTIKYDVSLFDLFDLEGGFDTKTNELKIYESGRRNDNLVFLYEKDVSADLFPKVIAIENQSILNWKYPGKEDLEDNDLSSDTEISVDSLSSSDFKFKIENNLKMALAAAKAGTSKFLVVAVDSKNPASKADFDTFLKNKELEIGSNVFVNDFLYVFNYYLATAEDEKWLKENKISTTPNLIILNDKGDILATSKSTLLDKKADVNDYYSFNNKLERISAFYTLDKVIKNKKATDADLISGFNNTVNLGEDLESDSVNGNWKLVKINFKNKEVYETWKKLIEAHRKDNQPNRALVETILKEIKNEGFSHQLFNEYRILNDTDFLAIDYLLKHYDAIERMNAEDDETPLFYSSLSSVISGILQQKSSTSQDNIAGKANQKKLIAVCNKMIAAGKGNLEFYKNYFEYLSKESDSSIEDGIYLNEFKTYFTTYLSGNGNVIERLDEIYADGSNFFDDWNSCKEYYSDQANSVAWLVVLKATNSSFIKDAITWSEYSLAVTKNNPYYLDTLAQLYYKDEQKQKAIQTQTLAVKFLNDDIDEKIASEMRETLNKMQKGVY
ncbi:hypothetical protein [Flavobacterium sp. 9]|uniref:hypothetical protein n=1 Tax=Flavobacterium sp. 9 TaxID=2035198 RepID=UPI001E62A7F7|nr:hypothetical protein [Flavobacterium sp. 9]